jgi:formylglycine-generating enzyme required for sulfatase activity
VGYSLFPEKSVESPLGAEPSRSPVAPSRAPATHKDKPTASKPDFRLWLVLGGLFVVILCGFGINYLIQNWPAAPAPTQTSEVSETSEVFTASPTFTAAPPIEPPTRIPTIPFTPEPGVGDTWISPKDGMVMMFVPAGKFSMGSDSGSDDEKPIHNVTLDSYWIDKTEVTNAMYAKCMQAGECDQPSDSTYFNNSEYADHPIVYVSWNNSQAYCDWRGDGTRLPTEAEWEKAASWDDDKKEKRVYPWGDSISCSFANYSGCIGDTAKVGNYPSGASFYGLLDMAGNVWEWVADWYDGYPGNTTSNSSFGTQYRVLRGGSWYDVGNYVRSSLRGRNDPAVTVNYFGFRCARSLP